MRILVVGSGAREHALCWRLSGEPGVGRVICAPGNPGIGRSVPLAAVDPSSPAAIVDLARREAADLTVIGPEAPLAAGVADAFAREGLLLFGPTAAAAQLETSKAFAKSFMERHGVPTARFRVHTSADDALATVRSRALGERVVVKADGLAAGKGVVVAPDTPSAEAAVRAAMIDRAFGDAGARVVLEECLEGPEVSFFVVADGEAFVPLLSAQDHKRVFDGDRGPNTGGMGAFAPSPLVTPALQARIVDEVVRPVLRGMADEGARFRGFLYCGLMITAAGPKVIEFNVRFGDPEAQVVLPLLTDQLAPVLLAAARGELDRVQATSPSLPPEQSCAVGIVLAAHGYPGDVRGGDRIDGLDEVRRDCPDVHLFFAGVKARDGALVTSGGRVVTVVACGADYAPAIERAYDAVARIRFDGMHWRTDIGRKALLR